MTEKPNPFDEALVDGLTSSASLERAQSDVDALVFQVAAAATRAGLGVEVRNVPKSRLSSLPFRFGRIVLSQTYPHSLPTSLGDDDESASLRTAIVARSGSQHRILWELELSPKRGYPIKLLGPEEGTFIQASTRPDLERAFLQVMRHPLVGRKLRSLASAAALARIPSEGEEE